MSAFLVVITGPPAAGKSTLGQHLRRRLQVPLFAKDTIKESLFDSLGWRDRAWSKRVSLASYTLMFDAARQVVGSGGSCIVEGNFRWHENEAHFSRFAAIPATRFTQVFCHAPIEVLMARMRQRIESGTRHPGHVDAATLDELQDELQNRPLQPLPLPGQLLKFDSTAEPEATEALIEQVALTVAGRDVDG